MLSKSHKQQPVITLTTDFGTTDSYAGLMKGVILGINPSARIVDLTHHIQPQNVLQAGMMVPSALKYFPEGTIHVVVVDPGVGTKRRIVALEAASQIILAPDNGLLSRVVSDYPDACIHLVTNAGLFLSDVSHTFHGRDIFAPVAAHLSRGTPLSQLGPAIMVSELCRLTIPQPVQNGQGCLKGVVFKIDHFGNIFTNIDKNLVASFPDGEVKRKARVALGSHRIIGLSQRYQDADPGQLLALFGSDGFLEIAMNRGNAAAHCGAEVGDEVTLWMGKKGR